MAYTNRTKTKPCPTEGCSGKVMTDELHRGFNAKVAGLLCCPDCKVQEIYERIGL